MFKLTVITITKNNPDQLKLTIASLRRLLKQRGVFCIIIDTSNHAIRKTNKILFKNKSNIVYVEGDWSGIAKSYNVGVSLVKDGWVWLLNASDYLNPEINIDSLIKRLIVSSTDVQIFSVTGYQSGRKWTAPPIARRSLPLDWIPQPGVIMTKSIMSQVGQFNERLRICLDTEYWIRLYALSSFSYAYNPISLVQIDEKGFSTTNPRIVAIETLSILFSRPIQLLKYMFYYPIPVLKILVRSLINLIRE